MRRGEQGCSTRRVGKRDSCEDALRPGRDVCIVLSAHTVWIVDSVASATHSACSSVQRRRVSPRLLRRGRPSPTSPNPHDLPFEVVYVGETRDLNARPLTGSYARVQGRFVDLFGATGTQHLWVAVCPLYRVAEDDQEYAYQRTRSFYEEALLAWLYAQKHKHPPILQVKKRKENEDWIDDAVLKLTHGRLTKPRRHRKS